MLRRELVLNFMMHGRRKTTGALALHDRLMPLHEAIFVESSPGPIKYAASLLDLCEDSVRLPLAPISEASKVAVAAALRSSGILN